ncbi:hypothetical protein PUR71_25825 [Streptomyces sp. SP17BM10]|uniref:hypothetical protein n=1 Tax=Streptomyces sp. SP17BM10 TaxID=3002530 RepID=UPI002E77E158|nr:hypothetical protein [Streptomyces sp. SP17BM10]MEE1786294.1 hypothetical protein [Streptomyces sp. SP17BM10]
MNRTTVGGPELGGGRGAGGVVVLVDPSGAGQSRVAALLAEELHPSVHLRTDDFVRVIRRGRIAPGLPGAERQDATALAAAAQAAFAYATGGYQVVVECPAAPPALDTFRRESRTTGAALHYVTLEADAPGTPEAAAETTETILTALGEGAHLLGW